MVFEELQEEAPAGFRGKQTFTDVALWSAIGGTRRLGWSMTFVWVVLTGTANCNLKVIIDLVIRDDIQYILLHWCDYSFLIRDNFLVAKLACMVQKCPCFPCGLKQSAGRGRLPGGNQLPVLFAWGASTGWHDLKHSPVPVLGRGLALPHKMA